MRVLTRPPKYQRDLRLEMNNVIPRSKGVSHADRVDVGVSLQPQPPPSSVFLSGGGGSTTRSAIDCSACRPSASSSLIKKLTTPPVLPPVEASLGSAVGLPDSRSFFT